MGQGKAQFAENGASFSRTATQHWRILRAPSGRVDKHPSALLCSSELAMASPVLVRLAAERFLTRCIRYYHLDRVLVRFHVKHPIFFLSHRASFFLSPYPQIADIAF